MPQIVVAAVQFIVAKVLAAAVIKTLVVNLLVTLALNAVSKALSPKPKSGWRGDSLQVSLDPNQNRLCLVGQTATAGSLVTFQTWGNKNEYIILLFAIADHPCEALVGLWNNGKRLTLNGDGSVQEYFADNRHNLWVTFYNGDWNQAADSELISVSGGRWTANERGRGVCYVKIKARYNEKAHGDGLSGLFQFLYEVKGARLYDRRFDSSVGGAGSQRANDQASWTWTDNAAVVLENVLRGIGAQDTSSPVATRQRDLIFGPGLGDIDLPFAANIAAMNTCDELVGLKAGGSEKRYRASGTFSVASTPGQVASDVLGTMAGKLTTGAGRWRILPGAAQSIAKYITDDDVRIDVASSYTQDRPLDETVNAVYGRFADPSAYYQPISLPARLSSADELTDSGRKSTNYELSFVTSSTQGQRVQEIHRRRGRRMRAAKMALGPEHMDLEPGDWVSWTSDRYGWTKVFEITPVDIKTDGDDFLAVSLALGEVDSSLYSWTPATDELDPAVPTNLSSALITGSAVTGLGVAATVIAQGLNQIPALAVSYNAITDPIATSLRLEYRVQGLPAAAAQTLVKEVSLRPTETVAGSTASLVLSDGVIGGYTYQVRGAVLTSPERDLNYSAWVATPTPTALLSAGLIGGLGPDDVQNALVAAGTGNRVILSDLNKGVVGWIAGASTFEMGAALTTGVVNGLPTLILTATAASAGQLALTYPAYRFACQAGEQLSVGAILGLSSTATGAVNINWWNASGNYIGQTSNIGSIAAADGFTTVRGMVTVPAGAVSGDLVLQANTTAAGFFNMYASRPMVQGVPTGQTVHPGYMSGPNAVPGADVTAANIAAAITGQGALATLNQATWATQVTGIGKPEDYATLSRVYRQATAPTAPGLNDIWIVLDGFANAIAVRAWNGSAWITGGDLTAVNIAAAITGQTALATAPAPSYAGNAAALAGGVAVGQFFTDTTDGNKVKAVVPPGGLSATVSPVFLFAQGTVGTITSPSCTVAPSAGAGTVTYQWIAVTNPDNILINSPTSATTVFYKVLAAGQSADAKFQCLVTNTSGQTASVVVRVSLTEIS
jgi:hypothetical protein